MSKRLDLPLPRRVRRSRRVHHRSPERGHPCVHNHLAHPGLLR